MHLQHGHSFLPFYVAHCVRKFCLLLEPKDKRGVPSETLLISAELAQLCALGEELPDMACGQRRDSHSSEDTPPPSSLGKEPNWSSLRSMQVLTTAPPPPSSPQVMSPIGSPSPRQSACIVISLSWTQTTTGC